MIKNLLKTSFLFASLSISNTALQAVDYNKEDSSSNEVFNNKEASLNKIAIIGAGYVGLVTGACFAQKGYSVTIVENNKNKIDMLLIGKVPFYEPGLDKLVEENINNKKISFVSSIKEAFEQKPAVIFSCVGTPPNEDGSADLSYVLQVAEQVGKNISEYCLIVNKSTVPVGSAKKVKEIISAQLKERGVSIDFDVASNPEFLKQGDAVNDFFCPDRIVIGVENQRAEEILRKIYLPFISRLRQGFDAQANTTLIVPARHSSSGATAGSDLRCEAEQIVSKDRLLVMDIPSAELTKYASNSMLATRISFMNELALLADKVGADISQVKSGMAADKRIGPYFLNAGIGYGGSCFPKDVKALIVTGLEYNQPMTIIQAVEDVNNNQRLIFAQKVIDFYAEASEAEATYKNINSYKADISGKHIGIWGLSFKPETDDLRCAPSIDIVNFLLDHGAKITVYDPVAQNNFKALFGDKINYAQTSQEILDQCDCLFILTEWKEFLKYTPADFTKLKDKTVFDGRNCFDPAEMLNSGINYICVGRNS